MADAGETEKKYEPRTRAGKSSKRIVVEGIEHTIDPRDGGNIGPDGEVLFLDEERQRRRENPRPMRKDRPDGLGIRNFAAGKMASMVAASDDGGKAFGSLVAQVEKPLDSPSSKFVYKFLGFDDNDKHGYTHVTVMPLSVDLSEEKAKHKSVIVPMDLIFIELEEAEEIAIMNKCICRTNFDCQEHPHDFGCIFMGPLAHHAVEQSRARMVNVEEAKAHVRKAAELGLMGSAEFVEGEQMIWGAKNSEMHEYRMFCFCCECCCLALKVLKEGQRDVSKRYTSCGWSMVVDHSKCMGCHKCAAHCPQQCISYREDDKCVIDQEFCLGCGFCKNSCESDALKLVQTTPMRESVNEFMLKEVRVDDGKRHKPAQAALNG